MSEYWIISIPKDVDIPTTFNALNDVTSKLQNLCTNYPFNIPELKVGTLDQLVGLSDDLSRLDLFVEQVTRKVASYLGDVLEDQKDKLHENLGVHNLRHQKQMKSLTAPTSPENSVSPASPRNNKLNEKRKSTGCIDSDSRSPIWRCIRWFRSRSEYLYRNKKFLEVPDPGRIPFSFPNPNSQSDSMLESKNANSDSNDNVFEISSDSLSSSSSSSASICSSSSSSSTNPNNHNSNVLINSSLSNNFHNGDGSCYRYHNNNNHHHHHHHHRHHHYQSRHHSASKIACSGKGSFFSNIDSDTLVAYVTSFNWDTAKYPTKQSLRQIADTISKQVGSIEVDLKQKSTSYNNLKGNLQNLEKKQTGSLLTRNLADMVKKEHFVLDSEYLTTLLVVVPKHLFNDWNTQYNSITDMIVPESSMMITHDNEYGLFTVTLFKKVVDEFKLHARERRFIVRDFTYNESDIESGRNEINKLMTDKKKQFGPLVRWLKVNFSECFSAWLHVKALRVFVESVLRYGLPVNFAAFLIFPNKKSTKRLHDVLNNLYGHLDGGASVQSSNLIMDNVDIPGLSFGQSEYYPYVCYKINIEMVDHKI